MLVGNPIDEDLLEDDAQPIQSGLHGLELRRHIVEVLYIDIGIAWERMKPRSALFDAATIGRARKEDDLVAIFDQKPCDREKWVEMPRRWCRSHKNFHEVLRP